MNKDKGILLNIYLDAESTILDKKINMIVGGDSCGKTRIFNLFKYKDNYVPKPRERYSYISGISPEDVFLSNNDARDAAFNLSFLQKTISHLELLEKKFGPTFRTDLTTVYNHILAEYVLKDDASKSKILDYLNVKIKEVLKHMPRLIDMYFGLTSINFMDPMSFSVGLYQEYSIYGRKISLSSMSSTERYIFTTLMNYKYNPELFGKTIVIDDFGLGMEIETLTRYLFAILEIAKERNIRFILFANNAKGYIAAKSYSNFLEDVDVIALENKEQFSHSKIKSPPRMTLTVAGPLVLRKWQLAYVRNPELIGMGSTWCTKTDIKKD